ncbi:MAG: hypothetical protein JSS66_04655 [Armatimonadetes bacterium]|nr:hypothetical protein [Armatimonadota bacterium]
MFIVPPRKVPGLDVGPNYVRSFNSLSGDVLFLVDSPLVMQTVDNSLTLSIEPNYYVKRSGDTVTGNLEFLPNTPGPYGLRLLSTTVEPTEAAIGALYYDTGSNVLRIYTSSGWQSVAQIGALTLSQANLMFLRLDASNDPLSGDLDMGTGILRFANRASNPVSGNLGDMYFNTVDNALKLYVSPGTWASVGSGITSISAGAGITLTPNPIVTTGTVAVNTGANFTWSGSHVFNNAITFASGQTFLIAGLSGIGQSSGDIIRRNGSTWERYGIGSSGQVLTVSGGLPVWATPSTGGSLYIGAPTDGVYTDGFFADWVDSTTTISNAFDDVNELLYDIAPARGNDLSGAALTQTTIPTMYSAVLPTGLVANDWYQGGKVAGNTISTYCVGSSFVLDSPNVSNTFQLGWKGKPSAFGTLYHKLYAAGTFTNNASYDLTTNSSGSSGSLGVVVSTYNTIWRIAAGTITYTHSADGYLGHSLNHTVGGESNKREYWRDTYSALNPNPSFSSAAAVSEVTPVDKWVSGIIYYDVNSTLEATFVAASGIFNRCYHPTHVATVACTGMTTLDLLPGATPAYNATYDRSSSPVSITLSVANQATPPPITTRSLTVTLYKPTGNTATSSVTLARPVNTYPSNYSTTTTEYFFDEGYRLRAHPSTTLFGSYSSSGAFDTVGNYAQVRNGRLSYPVVADYQNNPSPYNYTPTFTGDREYERYFYKTSASTGTLTFTGFDVANIAAYGSGSLNMLIYLESSAKWFDLGVDVGTSPGTRNGSSRSLAIGAKNTGSSGGTLNWSIGLYTTGPSGSGNDGKFRLVVVFRNSTYTIDRIVSS